MPTISRWNSPEISSSAFSGFSFSLFCLSHPSTDSGPVKTHLEAWIMIYRSRCHLRHLTLKAVSSLTHQSHTDIKEQGRENRTLWYFTDKYYLVESVLPMEILCDWSDRKDWNHQRAALAKKRLQDFLSEGQVFQGCGGGGGHKILSFLLS